MVNALDENAESATNSQTVAGLRRVMREAFAMTTANDTEKAELAVRRGLCYLLRESAVYGTTFHVLKFAHEATKPEFFRDPALGHARMEELVGANTTPVAYFALASDVFEYCARKLARVKAKVAKQGVRALDPAEEVPPDAGLPA